MGKRRASERAGSHCQFFLTVGFSRVQESTVNPKGGLTVATSDPSGFHPAADARPSAKRKYLSSNLRQGFNMSMENTLDVPLIRKRLRRAIESFKTWMYPACSSYPSFLELEDISRELESAEIADIRLKLSDDDRFQWIRVDDHLPRPNEVVVVVYFSKGWEFDIDTGYIEDGQWKLRSTKSVSKARKVQYWFPLPRSDW